MTHDFDHHEYNEMLAEWSLRYAMKKKCCIIFVIPYSLKVMDYVHFSREGIHVQLAHDGLRLPINL